MDLLVLVSVIGSEKDVIHQGCYKVLAFLGFSAAMINCLNHSGYVRQEAGVQFIIAIIAAFSNESESMSMNKDSFMEKLEKIKPFQVIKEWEGTSS